MNVTFPIRWIPGRAASRSPQQSLRPRDFDPPIFTRLLVLQPTPFCNLDCDYCYLPERDNRARMSHETIGMAVRRLAEDGLLGPALTVVWHAGEPLVLPPGYYERAFDVVAAALPATCEVTHSFQTNATLIDDRWCDLFEKYRVQVGVSVDGPAVVHDAHRRTRDGKGTHAAVLRGLATLRRRGIGHHAIAVVTAEGLCHPDAIHDFFVEEGIVHVGFNFDEAEGGHGDSSLVGREQQHGAFIECMLGHMFASGERYQVRELAGALETIATSLPEYRWRGRSFPYNVQTIPFAMVSVAWNGDFSTFSPELLGQPEAGAQSFVFGNVLASGYLDGAQDQAFTRFWATVRAGVDACRESCTYFDFCGGGSPANTLYENGSAASTETLYCRLMVQTPLETVLTHIERDVRD
jgi:uncharacterized protein